MIPPLSLPQETRAPLKTILPLTLTHCDVHQQHHTDCSAQKTKEEPYLLPGPKHPSPLLQSEPGFHSTQGDSTPMEEVGGSLDRSPRVLV